MPPKRNHRGHRSHHQAVAHLPLWALDLIDWLLELPTGLKRQAIVHLRFIISLLRERIAEEELEEGGEPY